MTNLTFTPTQELVFQMLTENTGAHPLDSGGAYGRNWQKNKKKTINDFSNEPEEKWFYDSKYKQVSRSVSVFHFLSQLHLDDICVEFNQMNTNPSDWDGDFYGCSKEATIFLSQEGLTEVRSFNTYNGDSDLSQILQGTWLENGEGEYYLLLQIHGGCDARGGYTDAKLFRPNDERDMMIHEYLRELEYFEELESAWDGNMDHAPEFIDEREPNKIWTLSEVLEDMAKQEA